jgi:hypothetical protein
VVLGVRAAPDGVGFFIVPVLPHEFRLLEFPNPISILLQALPPEAETLSFRLAGPRNDREVRKSQRAALPIVDNHLPAGLSLQEAPHRIATKHLSATEVLRAPNARLGHPLPNSLLLSATER